MSAWCCRPPASAAWKGQRVLIEAARLLAAQDRLGDAVVILAGGAQGRDGYWAELEQAIDAAGLAGRVRLVGHVDDMAAAFRTAHVAVIASTEPEAFGRTATEAQAMGTPVIATDIGAPARDRAERPARGAAGGDGLAGAAVGPRCARRCDRRGAGAQTPEERARMGERARAHVLGAFSLQAMKRETLKVYDSLLGTHLAEKM